jgi:large subunit ribosomal protein L30
MNIAAIRIRGTGGIQYNIERTMKMLNLHKKNFCSVYNSTPGLKGMLTKAKDYITWGQINDETLKMLYEKRGQEYLGDAEKKGKYTVFGSKRYKKFVPLHPPRGGFERKGIKTPYTLGGALGDRKEDINRLIKQML